MPPATIVFDFDPLLRFGDGLAVRSATLALAAVIVSALIALATEGRRTGLRPDDLLFVIVGTVPGAVIGGRLGYALVHLDLYRGHPASLFDPTSGGLELVLAVVGGLLTGGYVAHLLGAPIGRWLHAAAVPLLFAIGAGKLTMILAGSGQGSPSTGPFATAYLGDGPWGSLAPALPSHPSQAYEGLAVLLLAVLMAIALAAGAFGRRDGRAMLIALAAWTLIRAGVAVTWRDPAVLGPLNSGSLLAIAVGVGAIVVLVAYGAQVRRLDAEARARVAASGLAEPAWPDPWDRPRP